MNLITHGESMLDISEEKLETKDFTEISNDGTVSVSRSSQSLRRSSSSGKARRFTRIAGKKSPLNKNAQMLKTLEVISQDIIGESKPTTANVTKRQVPTDEFGRALAI